MSEAVRKKSPKRDLFIGALLLLGFGLAVALILTPLRFMVLGAVRGEATYHGKPTCYWAHELASDEGSAAAYQELQDGRSDAVPVLVAGLGCDTPKVRRACAAILGQCGAEAQPAVPNLARCLKDPDPILRQVAAEALGLIGPAAHEALSALREALKDGAANVRTTAAVALQRIEPAQKQRP